MGLGTLVRFTIHTANPTLRLARTSKTLSWTCLGRGLLLARGAGTSWCSDERMILHAQPVSHFLPLPFLTHLGVGVCSLSATSRNMLTARTGDILLSHCSDRRNLTPLEWSYIDSRKSIWSSHLKSETHPELLMQVTLPRSNTLAPLGSLEPSILFKGVTGLDDLPWTESTILSGFRPSDGTGGGD